MVYVDDVLLVDGSQEMIKRMAVRFNLGIQPLDVAKIQPHAELLSREIGIAEILVTPRSALIGQTIAQASFAEKYNVQVLGISRRGQPLEDVPLTSIELTFGDALLVRGTWESIGIIGREARNFVVVGGPAAMAQPRRLSPSSIIAILIIATMWYWWRDVVREAGDAADDADRCCFYSDGRINNRYDYDCRWLLEYGRSLPGH